MLFDYVVGEVKMKQHILEHWIKLAQEIQEGLDQELHPNTPRENWDHIVNAYDSAKDLVSYLNNITAI